MTQELKRYNWYVIGFVNKKSHVTVNKQVKFEINNSLWITSLTLIFNSVKICPKQGLQLVLLKVKILDPSNV